MAGILFAYRTTLNKPKLQPLLKPRHDDHRASHQEFPLVLEPYPSSLTEKPPLLDISKLYF